MVKGWKPVVIPEEIYEKLQDHWNDNQEELKLREGVRSLTGFIGFLLRESMKTREII